MSKFGDLVKGKKAEAPAPAAPTPPAPVAAPTPAAKSYRELGAMSKIELEELGRTKGIELDRRKSKSKLIKELKDVG